MILPNDRRPSLSDADSRLKARIFGSLGGLSQEASQSLRADFLDVNRPEPVIAIVDHEPCAVIQWLGTRTSGWLCFEAEFQNERLGRDAITIFAKARPAWRLPIERVVFGDGAIRIVVGDSRPCELGLDVGHAVYCFRTEDGQLVAPPRVADEG